MTGVVVNSVAQDTPAARAGLRTGDIITAYDGMRIEAEEEEDLGSFQRLVASAGPGQKAKLQVLRGGKERSVEVELASQPTFDPAEEESDVGIHVREITPLLAREQRLSTERGAWVQYVERGSPAGEAGVQIGDVIERIERREVGDLEDFRRAMREVGDRTRFLVEARRGDETRYLLVNRRARPSQPDEPEGHEEEAGSELQ